MDILKKIELNVTAMKLAKARNVKNVLLASSWIDKVNKEASKLSSEEASYLFESINKINEQSELEKVKEKQLHYQY